MRICPRCKTKMIDKYGLTGYGNGSTGLCLVERSSLFTKGVIPIRAAVCPDCGEVSLYIGGSGLQYLQEELRKKALEDDEDFII